MGFIENIKDKIEDAVDSYSQKIEKLNLYKSSDEIANKTGWFPANSGGTNMGTHKLKSVSTTRVEFRMRGIVVLFPMLFMIAGIGTAFLLSFKALQIKLFILMLIGIPFGLIFFLAGFFVLLSWLKPRVFDKITGCYWKGWKKPEDIYNKENNQSGFLNSIHAIQLLREQCSSSSGSDTSTSYYSYEINLVFKDAERLNIVDHGKVDIIRKDANKLANFIGVPLWDAAF